MHTAPILVRESAFFVSASAGMKMTGAAAPEPRSDLGCHKHMRGCKRTDFYDPVRPA